MRIEQFDYLSHEAMELRRQDGTKPWEVHLCEVDSLAGYPEDGTPFGESLAQARRLRDEIENRD